MHLLVQDSIEEKMEFSAVLPSSAQAQTDHLPVGFDPFWHEESTLRTEHPSLLEDERQWRAEDLEQRVLDNARAIWNRFTERTRYEVNERAEQLRSIGNLSALVAGFAMTSFLQFTFTNSQTVKAVILGFGISTALVVALSLNSMSMCGLIQASVFKMSHSFICEQEEEAFMIEAWDFAQSFTPGKQPPQPRRSFSKFWAMRCEAEWRRAFYMFSTAVPLVLANLTFASWIKFHNLQEVAIIMSAMLGVGIMLFGVMQGHWFSYIAGPSTMLKAQRLPVARQPAGLPFDWHLPPRSPRVNPSHDKPAAPVLSPNG